MKTISWSKSKLVLLGSVLFLSSFFFGGQANAVAPCIWTAQAGSSTLFGDQINWNSGAGCSFTSSAILFAGASSTKNVDFNLSTTTNDIVFDSAYTGVAIVSTSITVTSTGSITTQGGTSGTFTVGTGGTLVVNTNVNVSSTASFNVSGTLYIGGNLTVTSSLSSVNGTVFFTSSTGQTIGGPGNITFYDLTINGVVSASSSVTSTNDLTINNGGSFFLSTSTLNAGGNIITNGTTTQGYGNIIMTGTGKTLGGTKVAYANNLTIAGTVSLVGDLGVNTALTINSSKSLSGGGNSIYLAGSGTPFVNNGTFNANTSTFRYTGSSPAISATSSYYVLITVGTGTYTVSPGATGLDVTNQLQVVTGVLDLGSANLNHNVSGTLSVSAGTLVTASGGSLIMNGTGNLGGSGVLNLASLTVNGTTTLLSDVTSSAYLTINSGKTLIAGGNQLKLSGTGTSFINNGTFTANTSTVVYSGNTANVASTTYFNLTLSGATSNTITGTTTVNNLFTVNTPSVFEPGISYLVLTATGTPFINNSGGLSFAQLLIAYTGNGVNITSGSFYALLVDSASSTLTGDLTIAAGGNLTVNSGKVLNAANNTITFIAGGTPFVNNGTFNANISSVVYSVNNAFVASTTYYNLTINNVSSTLIGSTTVSNVLTVNANKTLNAGGNQLTLTGTSTPFVNNGTFTANTSTVVYSGITSTIASTTYYNLIVGNTTGTLGGDVTVNNTLTIQSGKLLNSGNGTSINLAGIGVPFVNSGTFVAVGNSGVSYTGSSFNVATNTTYATLSLQGTATIDGNVTVTGTLSASAYSLNQTTGTFSMTGGAGTIGGGAGNKTFYNLTLATTTLAGSVTTTNVLTVNGAFTPGSNSVFLTGANTPFVINGTFTPGTSLVTYSGSTANIASTTYYNLTFGTGTHTLTGQTTSTNAFTNSGTFDLSNYNFVSPGTYANSGTVTLSGTGVVKKQATGTGLDSTTYTSGSGNGTGNTITITVTDYTANLLAASADTFTVTVLSSNFSDLETVTLTETGAATGMFSGTIPFNIASAATANSKSDVSGNGNLTLAYSNGYGSASLTNASASYTGSTFSSGGGTPGGAGGGSAPSVSVAPPPVVVSAGAQSSNQVISLSLTATNATQVAISEDSGFAGASWDAYAPTKSFTLSNGAGEKTIYIKFRSATGGITAVYKVNVTLKVGYVPAPVTAVVAPVNTTSSAAVSSPAASVPVSASVESTSAVTQFEVTNPDSKVVIAPVKTLAYKPNSVVKYTYSYKNETAKTVKVKIVRSVVDAKGKVVNKFTGSASIAKGKTFKFNASNPLSNKVTEGNYTVKVQVLDFKTGKLVDENSFDITVKNPAPVVKKPVVKAPVKAVVPVVKKK